MSRTSAAVLRFAGSIFANILRSSQLRMFRHPSGDQKNAAIAITADIDKFQDDMNAIWDELYRAFQPKALPENSAGVEKLKRSLVTLVTHPAKKDLMNMKLLRCLLIGLVHGTILVAGRITAQAQDAQNPPAMPTEELPAGSQVVTGGPVHEAFAKPVSMDPQAPILVPQQPPENLQEVPPAERPGGANIVWVPGYWAWDTERNDFVWVSGCWRNAPTPIGCPVIGSRQ